MAVAYESDGGTVWAAANNNNAVTVPLPATRPTGSLLLLVAWSRLITDTVATAPSGYTLLSGFPVTSGTASGGRMWVYGKTAGASESAPTIAMGSAVTGTSGDIWGACLYCYSGVDVASILDGTPTVTDASGTTTCTYPALTISTTDAMLIRALARFRDAVDTFTPTATWNEREDAGTTNRLGGQHHLQDKLATASGAQASVTVAPSNTTAARYLAVTLALKAKVFATITGAANLTGTGGLSATGSAFSVESGQAALTGAGALTASGTVTPYVPPGEVGDVLIPAPAHVVLTGEVLAGQVLCGATMPADTWVEYAIELDGGASTLTTVKAGAAALTGTGSLTAVGRRTARGAAALTGVGSLTATGVRKKLGAAALTGVGSLTAVGRRTKYGAATLTGLGSLTAVGVRKKIGAALLTGVGALTAYGRRGRKGQAALSGQGTLLASPQGFNTIAGQAALTGQGTITASATARRDVLISENLLVELICGPTILTGQYLCGHIFSGDRWIHYQYDLLGNTLTLTIDHQMLVETGDLELLADPATLRAWMVLLLGDSAVMELLSDDAQFLGPPLLDEVSCKDTELIESLERQFALDAAAPTQISFAVSPETPLTLTAAPASTIPLEPVPCEEG